jgi:ABC-type branched-subunit amino acid transport system ATPase component
MALLEVTGLRSGYGKMSVLHGIDLTLDEREIVAVIGPNGAGKSTLMQAIFRVLPATEGRIVFDGRELTELPAHKLAALGMAYVPQEGNVFPELTVEQNLEVSVSTVDRAARKEAIERMLDLFPPLADRRRARAQTLSGGERQMLAVASALALQPRMIALDEPTSGMAPKVLETLVERIVAVRESGTAVLWVIGENASQAVEHLNRAYVLQGGEIVRELGADEPLRGDMLQSALLGRADPVGEGRA